jgi:hypothetical protein
MLYDAYDLWGCILVQFASEQIRYATIWSNNLQVISSAGGINSDEKIIVKMIRDNEVWRNEFLPINP